MELNRDSQNNIRLPIQGTRADLIDNSINTENRTIDICFSTGQRGLRYDWDIGQYYEELEISESAIRSQRLDKGISVLDNHNRWEGTSGVYGISESWRIENGELLGSLRFASDEESGRVFQKVEDNILRHFSLGYKIHRMRYMGDNPEDGLPIYRAIDWEPTEISIVPVSFETENGRRSDEQRQLFNCVIEDSEMFTTKHKLRSPEQPAEAPKGGQAEAPVVERTEQTVDPRAVRGEINEYIAAAKNAGFEVEHATRAFADNVTLADYRANLLDELGKRSEANAPKVPMVDDHRQDQGDTRKEDFSAAITAKITGDYSKLDDSQRGLGQTTILEATRHYMNQKGGGNFMGESPMQFAKRALGSTSDLPLILENVMHKSLRAAYEAEARTFLPIAEKTTVTDFRDKNTYTLSEAPDLAPLGENGEYQFGKLTESKEAYRLFTYARKIGFTRQMFVNDDMGALQKLPRMFGMKGVQLENDIVWGLILQYDFIRRKAANHTLSDGKALYHADHGNLITSPWSKVGLSALRKLGRDQEMLGGSILNVEYQTVAVGSTLETEAEDLLFSNIVPTTTTEAQTFKNKMNLIVEPRIDRVAGGDTAYYAFSQMYHAIEYAHLAGNEGMYTEINESTDIDGTEVLARHDFGAGFADFRGTAKSTGAG